MARGCTRPSSARWWIAHPERSPARSSLDDPLALLLLVEAFDHELLEQRLVAGVAAGGEHSQPLQREFVEAYGDRGGATFGESLLWDLASPCLLLVGGRKFGFELLKRLLAFLGREEVVVALVVAALLIFLLGGGHMFLFSKFCHSDYERSYDSEKRSYDSKNPQSRQLPIDEALPTSPARSPSHGGPLARSDAQRSRDSPRHARRQNPQPTAGQRRRDSPRHARRQNPGSGRRQRAGGGTVARTSATHSFSGSSPEMSLPSARVTGASTPARSRVRASSGTHSSASTAWPMRAGISAAGMPAANSSPARRLRLSRASAVATRSPVPARPIIDSGLAPRPSA